MANGGRRRGYGNVPCEVDQVGGRGAWPGIDARGAIQPGPPGSAWIRPFVQPDRAFRVTGFASIALGATGIAQTFTWQYPGTVIAFIAHTIGAAAVAGSTAGLASLGIQMTVGDGNESVFSNGAAGDFVSLFSLHGPAFNPFPLMRRVHQSEIWTIQFTNRSTDTAYIPELTLWFRRAGRQAGQSETARMSQG